MSVVMAVITSEQYAQLSERERKVFRFIVLGWTVKQIADGMGLSMKTVSTFRSRAARKLGTADARAWVQFAIGLKFFTFGW